MRKFSRATESEGKHFGCLRPQAEFPKCTEDDRAWRKEFPPGALLWSPFLGTQERREKTAARKVFEWDPGHEMVLNERGAIKPQFLIPRDLVLPTHSGRYHFSLFPPIFIDSCPHFRYSQTVGGRRTLVSPSCLSRPPFRRRAPQVSQAISGSTFMNIRTAALRAGKNASAIQSP
jgi:hypothetical protein